MKKKYGSNFNRIDPQEQRIVSLIKSQLAFGDGLSPELFHLKNSLQSAKSVERLDRILRTNKIFEKAYGPSFPKKLQGMFSRRLLYRPTDYISEVIWSIYRCLGGADELSKFVRMRADFEKHFLLDDHLATEYSLNELQKHFGASLWMSEALLSLAYNRGGIQGLYLELEEIQRNDRIPPIASNVIKLIASRIESTQDLAQQRQEIEKAFSKAEYRTLREYFDARVFGIQVALPNAIASLLFIEANSSLIDLYEALVASLQAIASIDNMPDDIGVMLLASTQKLYERSGDARLAGAARAFGLTGGGILHVETRKVECIEAYSRGDYHLVVKLSNECLGSSPHDMSMLVLMHKATANAKVPAQEYFGLLGKISKNLEIMFQMDDNLYSAVHELLKISDRFISLQWCSYLRCAVLYEIRQETDQFPPNWLRDIYVRDPSFSPFSAVAVPEHLRAQLLKSEEIKNLYPSTLAVYLAATEGRAPEFDVLTNTRLAKHLARFHLNSGNPQRAIDCFNSIIPLLDGVDRLRCQGGVVLAQMQLGDLSGAVNMIADAYAENAQIPTCLPIRRIIEAVDELGGASAWPKTMALPIVFQLYHEYESNDRLANLRVAFEKFQLANEVVQPEQLLDRGLKGAWVRLYLDRVWRPEVMRQTILYETSREIEEARIKVCQLLVKLDLTNEDVYLEEIKERVKRLEIAKGLKLVEQSKVYVDIPAIKKVVLKKLENPYRHYKLNQETAPQSEHVAEQIAETLSQAMPGESLERLLGSLHILSGEGATEEDVQFN